MIQIVIIDDSPFIIKAIKKTLEPHGFNIIGHALNGKDGLEVIWQKKPDIVILDVTMPIMDGLETAKFIFEHKIPVKVIMLSAMGDDELIETAKNYGVKEFLNKPLKTDDLINVIKSLA